MAGVEEVQGEGEDMRNLVKRIINLGLRLYLRDQVGPVHLALGVLEAGAQGAQERLE